ncbi:S1 family peptidase [Microvirga makkahensis]|uniref:Trypsin-like serine protease n=1 Tax=Microvirga makkahensis TaxID=1128670 RepID=A0A7X3SR61_9HYPH|nr:trypsin-like serine protease [Microvirga makkahensis]MXQ13834.1 trypsin-like serine protease [Microvirga makkahensis]
MRALPFFVLLALTFFTGSAQAILLGAASRDPNGLRRSVVFIENSTGELCSGALIGPNLVLTAAHCVTDAASYRVVAVNRAFKRQRIKVVALAIHPTFVTGTTPRTQPGVDLAILRLEQRLGADFLPLDPTLAGRIDVGDAVTIAGFGVSDESRKGTARILRHANLVSLGPIEVANRVLIVADPDRLAETSGAGACRGDSGGPILAATQDSYLLYGVVSWSSGALRSSSGGRRYACGGLTAVTPLAEHLGWVRQAVRSLLATDGAWTRR